MISHSAPAVPASAPHLAPHESAQVARPGLSRREHEMLAFERQWWRRPGAKETAIRDLFGMTPTRYYQVLNTLVDRPDALASDPLLVRRLRRGRAPRGGGGAPPNPGGGGGGGASLG